MWTAYYAAQGPQAYSYPAGAVQPTLQSVAGQQAAATPYATLSRAAVTPQPSTTTVCFALFTLVIIDQFVWLTITRSEVKLSTNAIRHVRPVFIVFIVVILFAS